jgi:hypothetical protein
MDDRQPTYAELEQEVDRLRALLEQRYEDVRLVEMRGGEMILEGGPVGYFAAYMAEMLEPRDNQGKSYANYVEMKLSHDQAGPLCLTLQRSLGQTPHQLRREAEVERDALIVALHAAISRPKGVVPTEAERWYRSDLALHHENAVVTK